MQYDAIVIGGSFAGLSAATYIARGMRTVCVIDAGMPRNRFADASHGFFAQDGSSPLKMIAEARDQLGRYPAVRLIDGKAMSVRGQDGAFEVTLAEGSTLTASKLVLAFGLTDDLPDIPGLQERWGKSVLHCPYCHGFEFAGRPQGVLNTAPHSFHQAQLIAQWGPTTFFLNGGAPLDREQRLAMEARDVAVEPGRVTELRGEGSQLKAIALEDGRAIPVEALYLAPQSRLNSPIAEQRGCAIDTSPLGPIIRTNPDRMTNVPGVYAVGDIAQAPHNVASAAASGVAAGMGVHTALFFGGTT
jgi:thioredoxin reductase